MRTVFSARDMKEALAACRVELGADAVILESKTTADGGVVIHAMAGENDSADEAIFTGGDFDSRYRDGLLLRLRDNPSVIQTPQAFDRATLLRALDAHRLPAAVAHQLAEDAEKSGLPSPLLALSSALDERMAAAPIDFARAEALLLIGPYGAGKTSVAAKLAAGAMSADRAVRLIATDVESAGQLARLEIFAEHLEIEIVAAPDPEAFAQAIATARKDGVLAIADSAGCDPRRPAQPIVDLAKFGGADSIGVVSAATDAEDARDIAAALKNAGAKHLIVTCLDLAQRKGALAMLAISGLPIAHTASSPYLVAGLDSPTPLSLARSLLSSIDDQASEVLG